MIDLPGIIEGAKDGRGRGRQVIAVAKTCHLIFIVLDVNKPLTDKRVIETELEGFGIRINKGPPNITFKKKDKGGLNISSTVPLTHITNDEIKAVMNEYRINSADIAIRCDATVDDLIDILEARSRSYIPVIYVLNKIDAISIEELDLLYRIPNAVPISSEHGWNIDELMEAMYVPNQLHGSDHSTTNNGPPESSCDTVILLLTSLSQVGEASIGSCVHQAQGKDAGLFGTCRATFQQVYRRRFREWALLLEHLKKQSGSPSNFADRFAPPPTV
jgi:hypothetical protein